MPQSAARVGQQLGICGGGEAAHVTQVPLIEYAPGARDSENLIGRGDEADGEMIGVSGDIGALIGWDAVQPPDDGAASGIERDERIIGGVENERLARGGGRGGGGGVGGAP